MKKIIRQNKSIIPACDVSFGLYEKIVQDTADIEKVGAYKIGFCLLLSEGLLHLNIPKKTLYNHKSGACDIPDTGEKMIHCLKFYPNIEGVILTPLTGPATQKAWTEHAQKNNKRVYIEPVLETDTYLRPKLGYIEDSAVDRIIQLGLEQKVDGFIFPDNDLSNCLIQKNSISEKVIWRRQGKLDSEFSEITCYDVMPHGLSNVVSTARKYTDKPIIYDHQKAGTDIPANAAVFSSICRNAGVNAVIFFPLAGPDSQVNFIAAALNQGLDVIVGGMMTHPNYVASENGYVSDKAVLEIYDMAANLGISDYVVPGNKPEIIKNIRSRLIERRIEPVLFAPGFIKQDGKISDAGKVAGPYWHAITGRGLYETENIRQAALELTRDI